MHSANDDLGFLSLLDVENAIGGEGRTCIRGEGASDMGRFFWTVLCRQVMVEFLLWVMVTTVTKLTCHWSQG